MGPQLYRCGDYVHQDRSLANEPVSLQWGRNFIVAETLPDATAATTRSQRHASMGPQLYRCGDGLWPVSGHMSLTLLQWGRNFIVAETRPMGSWMLGLICLQASMGPQLYRCGDSHVPSAKVSNCGFASFNGAATLSLRRPKFDGRVDPDDILLQWGRNFIVAETSPHMRGSQANYTLQWGRTLSLRRPVRTH